MTAPSPERFPFIYSVKFLCGVQKHCECKDAPVRPGIYATEINIHNYQDEEVGLQKSLLPVVLLGAANGREPRHVRRRGMDDKIDLPPHAATMDDCQRFGEMLFGEPSVQPSPPVPHGPASPLPLTVGILVIRSTHDINVTAVYTATDLESRSISIDVEYIMAKRSSREIPPHTPTGVEPPTSHRQS